ncbi:myeloid-associated differentiation marker [Bombina bombina]|uniref:myeloid-associated differentiation marker n=1 Tax=Bombina bombina TaxID=8345 RepID=UPI00235AC8CA|nr:myeloid-associated differentiation marker [Bombina bombina]XP_053546640.1 myeloid-associated differentiation marker [Bombina bombina]XP_053546641.1 myeloid-associated differentiation marker [Bombina bombina]
MPVHQRTVVVGNTKTFISSVCIVRFLEAIFACVTFSLVAHLGNIPSRLWDLCMFSWCFCFAVTIVILIVEFAGVQNRMPVSWKNFPITFAMYAVLMCLSASCIYPVFFLNQSSSYNNTARNYQIVATLFSCLTTLAYIIEVSLTRAKPGEVTGYMATTPGLLKVVETYTACIIFVFISDPPQYENPDALKWCLAVYCICFILSVGVIILCVGECTGWLPCAFNKFLSAYALLAVLLYITVTIMWPVYKFDKNHGGSPSRPSHCSNRQLCLWDKQVAIAVLTGLNLLFYIMDLIYSARLIFITV